MHICCSEGNAQLARGLTQAQDVLNRFWTLVNHRYDVLWRSGAWIFGRAVDEQVPPILSRDLGPRKAKPTDSPQPAAQATEGPVAVNAPVAEAVQNKKAAKS